MTEALSVGFAASSPNVGAKKAAYAPRIFTNSSESLLSKLNPLSQKQNIFCRDLLTMRQCDKGFYYQLSENGRVLLRCVLLNEVRTKKSIFSSVLLTRFSRRSIL